MSSPNIERPMVERVLLHSLTNVGGRITMHYGSLEFKQCVGQKTTWWCPEFEVDLTLEQVVDLCMQFNVDKSEVDVHMKAHELADALMKVKATGDLDTGGFEKVLRRDRVLYSAPLDTEKGVLKLRRTAEDPAEDYMTYDPEKCALGEKCRPRSGHLPTSVFYRFKDLSHDLQACKEQRIVKQAEDGTEVQFLFHWDELGARPYVIISDDKRGPLHRIVCKI